MSKEALSDFEESPNGKYWPGYCQLVSSTEGISLNFSRVPMHILPPRPSGCTIFTTPENALTDAIERVAAIPTDKGKRSNKVLQPSHITFINESNHATS